jgi:tetratricopeptide (TPR) repeat protein
MTGTQGTARSHHFAIPRFISGIRRRWVLNRGLALARAGKATEALETLSQVSDEGAPEDALVHNARAGILFSLGKYNEALVEVSLAIARDPSSPDLFINRGNILRGLGLFKESAYEYSRALMLNPADTVGFTALAAVLNRIGQYQESLAAADRAIALDPDCEPAWFQKGTSLYALGRFEEAKTAFFKAPGPYPNDGYSWAERAKRLKMAGRTADAQRASDMAALIAVKNLNIRRCDKELERKEP